MKKFYEKSVIEKYLKQSTHNGVVDVNHFQRLLNQPQTFNEKDIKHATVCLKHILDKRFYTTAAVRDDIHLTLKNLENGLK